MEDDERGLIRCDNGTCRLLDEVELRALPSLFRSLYIIQAKRMTKSRVIVSVSSESS